MCVFPWFNYNNKDSSFNTHIKFSIQVICMWFSAAVRSIFFFGLVVWANVWTCPLDRY